jgi:hypothetical protein
MGIEPTTYSLGSCRSTTELRPHFNDLVLGKVRKRYSKRKPLKARGRAV